MHAFTLEELERTTVAEMTKCDKLRHGMGRRPAELCSSQRLSILSQPEGLKVGQTGDLVVSSSVHLDSMPQSARAAAARRLGAPLTHPSPLCRIAPAVLDQTGSSTRNWHAHRHQVYTCARQRAVPRSCRQMESSGESHAARLAAATPALLTGERRVRQIGRPEIRRRYTVGGYRR